MAKTTPLELFEPFVWFEKQIKTLLLKSPTGFHAAQYGEPRFLVRMVDGSSYWIEKDEVVTSYLGDLLTLDGNNPVEGGANAMLRAMSLPDFLQTKEAFFDFFTAARGAISERSAARSSTASGSSQQTPATD
jgi:hypothetical protein